MPIDTRPLFGPVQPSPMTQGLAGIGSVLDAIMQRRHQMALQKQQQQAQAEQSRLDREAQQSHWNQIDTRERERYAAEDKRYQQKTRAEMARELAEDYAKNQGRAAPIIAQGYGGKLEDVMEAAKPDPRTPELVGIDEDPTAPPMQSVNTGRKRVTMPGGDPFEFEPPPAAAAGGHYQRMREQLMGLGPSPMQQIELRRLAEAEALGLDAEKTANYVERERQRAATERNARISAGGVARREADRAAVDARARVLVDREGNPTGLARTAAEAGKARGSRPTVVAAEKAGADLKSHIDKFGNISRWNPMDWVRGDVEQQAVRDQIIDRLIGARKEITGALNASDVDRYKKQLDTAASRGPEAVKQAVDSFVGELQTMYDAQNESVAEGPLQSAPAGGDRLEAWKRKRGKR